MRSKCRNQITAILVLITIGFLVIVALLNYRLLWKPAKSFVRGRLSFAEFTENVQENYTSDFSIKNDFVNLNGWFANAINQTTCNDVMKLKNGMLLWVDGVKRDMHSDAESVVQFRDYLADQGIPFLYAEAPFKLDKEQQLLPGGFENHINQNIDAMLSFLKKDNVNTIDMRTELSTTPEQVTRYFSRTDHHWNFYGAFTGYQLLVQKLQEMLPEKGIDITYANFELWESHKLDKWFLGSMGKRVGIYYAGTDDIIYYTPKFETHISRIVPRRQWLFKGDFVAANTIEHYILHRDYFNSDAYGIYLGGNYPLTQYRNPDAPNDTHLLILRDSFSNPVEAFLSTMFKEVDAIDPRSFDSLSFSEYAYLTHPDIVINLYNQGTFGGSVFFKFGVSQAREKNLDARHRIAFWQNIEVSHENIYAPTSVSLESNSIYHLHFDDVEFISDTADGAAVTLYDLDSDRVIDSMVFDVEYARINDGFQWFFTIPEDIGEHLELRFYANLPDNSIDGDVIYRNVRLEAVG